MKTYHFACAILYLLISLTSCKKDASVVQSLRVTYQGFEWTAPVVTAQRLGSVIQVVGTDPLTNEAICITVPSDLSPGTYTFASYSDDPVFDFTVDFGDGFKYDMYYPSTLILETIDLDAGIIQGKFEFVIGIPVGVLWFTDGEFSANF